MSTLLSITSSRIQLADGKFDSQKRYLRAGTSGAYFAICQGRTFVATTTTNQSNNNNNGEASWRYSCGTFSMDYVELHQSGAISYDPGYTLVTT